MLVGGGLLVGTEVDVDGDWVVVAGADAQLEISATAASRPNKTRAAFLIFVPPYMQRKLHIQRLVTASRSHTCSCLLVVYDCPEIRGIIASLVKGHNAHAG